MVRMLETGERLSEREADAAPPNRIRPEDKAAQARRQANKDAVFRKM